MAGLTHPNLVHCLASFTFGADTYLIYPLAEEGNLEEFMEKYRRPNTEFTQSWLVTQLRGLAAALLVIHDQEEAPTAQSHLRVEQAASGRTGYVHDIKPENILVIIRKGQIILFRLSDFSCAKVVEFITSISGKRDTHLTVSKSGTPNYRPPESQTGKTSRPYDLWSLGCVYLELLTWFVEGYEALEAFREARFGFVCPGKIEDEGFYFSAEGGENANWRLRNAVITKLNVLRPKCEGALKEILDVIPFLLSINPKQRMTAAKLAQTLKISGSSLGSTGERKRVDSVHMEEGSPLQDPASPADESNFVAGGPEITVTTH
jgi:serine/threonine protein kinase